jgi:hypothetical protein
MAFTQREHFRQREHGRIHSGQSSEATGERGRAKLRKGWGGVVLLTACSIASGRVGAPIVRGQGAQELPLARKAMENEEKSLFSVLETACSRQRSEAYGPRHCPTTLPG